MKLEALLARFLSVPAHVRGSAVEVHSISDDSRNVTPGTLFVARTGTTSDGRAFVADAVTRGAVAVLHVGEDPCADLPAAANVVRVRMPDGTDLVRFSGLLAERLEGNPSEWLRMVGITGTNGKTTMAFLIKQFVVEAGSPCGVIGTVVIDDGAVAEPANLTTPGAIETARALGRMVRNGCSACAMEVSSHALDQGRADALRFRTAVFSNLTGDHLDYHGTMDHYVAAKKLLFDGLAPEAFALVNSDDKHGETMLLNCGARQITYALKRPADIKVKVLESHLQGTLLSINQRECWSQLIGGFNAYNMAAMYGVAVELGIPADEALQALSAVRSVDGRFQKVPGPEGRMGIVDYAHTPDALENMLKTLQELNQGAQQLITVIGCGGDRDKGKRPIMAGIAADRSTKAILDDMEAGLDPVQKRRTLRISDRAQAIKLAVQLAKPGDVILVAGKGHETYQEIAGIKHPFDDVATLKDQFNAL